MFASARGRHACVGLLLKTNTDVNRTDKHGLKALMLSARNGHDKCLELIQNKDCDLKQVTSNGFDALMLATTNGHGTCVEILLDICKRSLWKPSVDISYPDVFSIIQSYFFVVEGH